MKHRGQVQAIQRFEKAFGTGVLVLDQLPKWVKVGIGNKLVKPKICIISAVCPDYEIANGKFTYRNMGDGLPHTAARHLEFIKQTLPILASAGITFEYHMTLADTEFDLPMIVKHLAGGNPQLFQEKCQKSCEKLMDYAKESDAPLVSCERFTSVFPDWFEQYHKSLQILADNPISQGSVSSEAWSRVPLYRAMAGREITIDYSREMVVRQRAQYMAWGECATRRFGDSLIMINHLTPNLEFINHPAMRRDRPRIPIIKLPISTMPAS